MMLLYSLLLGLGLLLASPWWLFRMATTQRYREGLSERLGRVPTRLGQTIAGKRAVWLHAVSVGEVLAAARLVHGLEASLGEGWQVVVSTTTRTGQALARERLGAERVFYFPLDFAWAVRAYLRVLRPAALVLMESELWPRTLHECARLRVPVVVANARVSDRSFARGMKLRGLWRSTLRKVSLWLTQSEEDARRLIAMGAEAKAVQVAGNLKYDVRAPHDTPLISLLRKLLAGRPLVVAGSTTDAPDGREQNDEEEIIVGAWRGLAEDFPEAVLLIGPRHPERFAQVLEDMKELQPLRASELLGDPDLLLRDPELVQANAARARAICLDTIGDLASVYSLANVALVGGSLVPRGGHNPLEPAQFGVPVVIGPSYENFRDIVNRMKAADAIRILDKPADLEMTLRALLTEPETARAMGARGRQVFEQQGGATARTAQAVLSLIWGALA